jgi:hypothetical protein
VSSGFVGAGSVVAGARRRPGGVYPLTVIMVPDQPAAGGPRWRPTKGRSVLPNRDLLPRPGSAREAAVWLLGWR